MKRILVALVLVALPFSAPSAQAEEIASCKLLRESLQIQVADPLFEKRSNAATNALHLMDSFLKSVVTPSDRENLEMELNYEKKSEIFATWAPKTLVLQKRHPWMDKGKSPNAYNAKVLKHQTITWNADSYDFSVKFCAGEDPGATYCIGRTFSSFKFQGSREGFTPPSPLEINLEIKSSADDYKDANLALKTGSTALTKPRRVRSRNSGGAPASASPVPAHPGSAAVPAPTA